MPANKKPAMSWEESRDVTRVLDRLSKAALLDCVVDLLREHAPSVDDPVTEEIARKRLESVIERRGDHWPKPRGVRARERAQRAVRKFLATMAKQ